jgi:hypothetical protein
MIIVTVIAAFLLFPCPGSLRPTNPLHEAAEIGEFFDLDVALGEAERTSFFLACGNLGKSNVTNNPDTPSVTKMNK